MGDLLSINKLVARTAKKKERKFSEKRNMQAKI